MSLHSSGFRLASKLCPCAFRVTSSSASRADLEVAVEFDRRRGAALDLEGLRTRMPAFRGVAVGVGLLQALGHCVLASVSEASSQPNHHLHC
eukprot:758135-Hanusia_phi.AAC.3